MSELTFINLMAMDYGDSAAPMWQLERDRQCRTPASYAEIDCSSVVQRPFAFTHALAP